MELVLVHITDIHLENDTDYNILEARSEYIANAINKHIIDEANTLLILCNHWRYSVFWKRRAISISVKIYF